MLHFKYIYNHKYPPHSSPTYWIFSPLYDKKLGNHSILVENLLLVTLPSSWKYINTIHHTIIQASIKQIYCDWYQELFQFKILTFGVEKNTIYIISFLALLHCIMICCCCFFFIIIFYFSLSFHFHAFYFLYRYYWNPN